MQLVNDGGMHYFRDGEEAVNDDVNGDKVRRDAENPATAQPRAA
jgi:hypothetical protein